MTVYAFTGHRPKDLRDWDSVAFGWALEAGFPYSARTGWQDAHFITGGALGVDTWAAQYALDHGIHLHIILPFTVGVMTKMWRSQDRERLIEHVRRADAVTILDQSGQYHPEFYQKRNEAMINLANEVIAVWSGKQNGGTWNAIQYANRIGSKVTNIFGERS